MASMSAAERMLHIIAGPPLRCLYRVTAHGLRNLPSGGFLLLPNHITWVDAIVLQLACPRPIRYIIDQGFYRKPILHPFLRLVGCIPIDARHSHSAIRAATEKTAQSRGRQYSDRARRIAQARRILFQPPAVVGPSSGRRMRARTEA